MTDISRLIILHTNDLHSCFENMPRLATRIEHYRTLCRADELLLIDCGDHADRARFETEGTGGLANVAVMNETGYDVFVPGNNEGLTFPKPAFESAFRSHARFAVLGTNMLERSTGRVPPWMCSRLIIDKGALRVGLIGLTASYNDFYHPLGWHVTEPLEAAAEAAAELRGAADLIVAVSHAGLKFDRMLAEQVPGIDVIVGGHTHHLFEEAQLVGGTLIGAAGKLGSHLGVIEIEYDEHTRKISRMRGYAEEVKDEPEHPRVASLIERYRAAGQAELDQPVAALNEPVPHRLLAESPLGNLLAEGLRRWTGAEIGLVNSGQLLSGLDAGLLTGRRLLAVCPSPINPCSMELHGRELLEALELSLLDDHIRSVIRGFGFRGEVLGSLCVSGIDIVYDGRAPERRKIQSALVGGEPIEPDRVYKVGTIDMFTFGVGYPALQAGRDIRFYLPEFIRDVLRAELQNPQSIAESAKCRWKRVDPPSSWNRGTLCD